jgi:Domain of unknown function (DUF4411)
MRYWLDSDALISANNGPYPVRNAHGFWGWLDGEIANGRIVAAERTFNEVVKGRTAKDELAVWMNLRKSKGICMRSNKDIDAKATIIGDYVNNNEQHPIHQKLEFFRGADAWVIAYAWQDMGTVVSNESGHFPKSERVRIPDVCYHFEVRCITRDALIKEINAQF